MPDMPKMPQAPEPEHAEPAKSVGFPSPTNPVPKPHVPKPPTPKPPKPPKPAATPTPPRKQSPLGFYSNVHDALRTWQPKGTPEQLLAHLQKHAGAQAQAEIHGFHDWLKGKPQVTREEAAGFFEDKHPELEEHSESDRPSADEFADDYEPEVRTHFDDYQLPGPAEGYDEMHIAAPGVRHPQKLPFVRPEDFTARSLRPGTISIFDKNGKEVDEYEPDDASQGIDPKHWINATVASENRNIAAQNAKVAEWEDGHHEFAHIQNPVVRARFNSRTDAEGKKMLFLEELQGPSDANQKNMPEWLRERIYDIGLKRMLRKAADEGYERIGWTTGNHQADRYNLRNKVDRLEWMPTGNGEYGQLIGIKDGEAIVRKSIESEGLSDYVGKEVAAKLLANKRNENTVSQNEMGAWDVSNHMGTFMSHNTKEEADAWAEKNARIVHSVEGPDLEVGGHGLKNLYDRVLPAKAAKLLKRAGAKVAQSKIGNGKWSLVDDGEVVGTYDSKEEAQTVKKANDGLVMEPEYDTVHSIDLTPGARDLIKEGFAMYKKADGGPLRYYKNQPRSLIGGVSIDGRDYRGGTWLSPKNAHETVSLNNILERLQGHVEVDNMTQADMLRAAHRYESSKADYAEFLPHHLNDRCETYLGGQKRPGHACELAWMVDRYKNERR